MSELAKKGHDLTVYNLQAEIRLPFKRQFREPLWNGTKTCTSRMDKMGNPGDTFLAFGARFQINYVWRTSLGVVRTGLWKREGVESPVAFELVWIEIHPRARFDPARLVYVHEFSRFDPDHPYPERPCRSCKKPFVPTLSENQFHCVDCIELHEPYDEGDEAPD